jgi:hypothetical protein
MVKSFAIGSTDQRFMLTWAFAFRHGSKLLQPDWMFRFALLARDIYHKEKQNG